MNVKAIAAGVLYTHGDPWNMVYASHSNVTAQPPEAALPLLLIPTLRAARSERRRDVERRIYEAIRAGKKIFDE